MVKRVVVVSYKYPTEISPTVKGIITYLEDKEFNVEVFLDKPSKGKEITFRKAKLTYLTPSWLLVLSDLAKLLEKVRGFRRVARIFNAVILRFIDNRALNTLKDNNLNKDIVYCIEAHSLFLLGALKIDLSNTIYFSLESEQVISCYDENSIKVCLSRVAFMTIQSEERYHGFSDYFSIQIPVVFMPVSMRPPKKTTLVKKKDNILKLIYSGYISEWSGTREVVNAYLSTNYSDKTELVIQGHDKGTEEYAAEVKLLSYKSDSIYLNGDYFSDDEHIRYLQKFDIGFALYLHVPDSPNWNNLIFSSGKIATYLWAGLSVITNLEAELTKSPPFIFVKDINGDSLKKALHEYTSNKSVYKKAALKIANDYYNLDRYMDTILEKQNRLIW